MRLPISFLLLLDVMNAKSMNTMDVMTVAKTKIIVWHLTTKAGTIETIGDSSLTMNTKILLGGT